ncbi:hypothetical protein BDZ45DRAFT_753145 [Acephala macrosclerotiorum]|nr:hypothetical protein BDZ45DRAFT_753145 [Acephala macrosclerotiorum]
MSLVERKQGFSADCRVVIQTLTKRVVSLVPFLFANRIFHTSTIAASKKTCVTDHLPKSDEERGKTPEFDPRSDVEALSEYCSDGLRIRNEDHDDEKKELIAPPNIKEHLVTHLDAVTAKGAYGLGSSLRDAPNPRLFLEGHNFVRFPLSEGEIQMIKDACGRAAIGNKMLDGERRLSRRKLKGRDCRALAQVEEACNDTSSIRMLRTA